MEKLNKTLRATKSLKMALAMALGMIIMASASYGAWDHPEYVRATKQLRKIYQAYNKAPHKQTLTELKAQVNPIIDVIQTTYYRNPGDSLTVKTTYYKKKDVIPNLKTPTLGEIGKPVTLIKNNQIVKTVHTINQKKNANRTFKSQGTSFQNMAKAQRQVKSKKKLKNVSDTLFALHRTK